MSIYRHVRIARAYPKLFEMGKSLRYITGETLRMEMNRLGTMGHPFLWGISYDMSRGFIFPDPLAQCDILWQTGDCGNAPAVPAGEASPRLETVCPVPRETYSEMFAVVKAGLMRGDSFLANLTGASEVRLAGSLRDVFIHSRAPYRLLLGDEFVCFSPEPFVRITGNVISTFPMKGTADASVEGSDACLMADYKELCEHYTIVDLMRNDLSAVASDVRVARFRYLERIATASGGIWQTSSEITGRLPEGRERMFGDIIFPLLPAGSITGAPKEATVALVGCAETVPRGWYTGVFGYFDGMEMRSAVMIRCIQRGSGGRLFFHSGGGITVNSDMDDEYAELVAKVYLSSPGI